MYIFTCAFQTLDDPFFPLQSTHEKTSEELMCGHSKVPIPGGFGATAGPNDGYHQALHSLTKSYLRVAVGWGSSPQLRKRFDELQMGLHSKPSTQ